MIEEFNKEIYHCDRCEYSDKVLTGKGDPDSDVMIIGESPSLKPERNDMIFGGKSKDIFLSFVENLGLKEGDYYITNLIKCYTPDKGTGHESQCRHFLKAEIAYVNPGIVITLGKKAAEFFPVDNYDMRGYRARLNKQTGFVVITVYHPMYVYYKGISEEEYKEIAERVRKILESGKWF